MPDEPSLRTKPRRLKDWIDAYMELTFNSEPPTLYRKWTAVSVIAACLQRKVYVPFDGPLYPNLYIVLVGPSGRCKKGTAMRPGQALLRTIGVKLCAEAITREALIREIRHSWRQVIDSASKMPKQHSSLTVFSEELTVFLGYQNKQLMSDLCNLYDCGSTFIYRCKDQTKTDEITNVWLNIIGGTTPNLIYSTMPMEAIGGGLTGRMIFVYEVQKAKIVEEPWARFYNEDLPDDLVADLRDVLSAVGEFKYAEDFIPLETQGYREQEENPPFKDPMLYPYIDRRRVHLLKLSMIMSAARSNELVLRPIDYERAKSLLLETEVNMEKVFRGVGRKRLADIQHKVMLEIASAKVTSMKKLLQVFYKDLDKFELIAMLTTLDHVGYCTAEYRKEISDWHVEFISEEEKDESEDEAGT